MRIISGTYRGLRIATLKGDKLRPTSDQLRETVFDVIGPRIVGARFLDAYAGSGAVGLEALSRGANYVVFIEHHRPAIEVIRKNLLAMGIESGFRLMVNRALTGLEKLAAEGQQFDYVFIDPPYDEIREYHHVLRQIGRLEILLPGATVIAEHSRHCLLESDYGNLTQTRVIRHGDSQLAFYQSR